jgi:hypothetical protein
VNYATGTNPNCVFAADLDGDGDRDLAASNAATNNVSILRNNGDASFAAPVNYATGGNPMCVAAADLDGDGDLDLAVPSLIDGNVRVLKNHGNATFAAGVSYFTGSQPQWVAVADLDGDGDRDLAVANFNDGNVSILKNNGDGTFAAATNFGAGGLLKSVAAADLDGDWDLDLAFGRDETSILILANDGSGSFSAPTEYFAGADPFFVLASDLDGNGNLDLAVANFGSSDVSIILNCGAILPGYTPVGTNVSISLPNGVSTTFSSVTDSGHTALTTSSSGPPPPSGFNLVPAAPPVYYDIQTTATYTGPITVCFPYNPADVSGAESDLRVFHNNNDGPPVWDDVTVLPVDETNNVICASVTTLSPFVLAEPSLCACDCHGDPAPIGACDGVQDILDVVQTVNVAFRGAASILDPNTACPYETTDTNCSLSTDVIDVVKMVNVAFRGANVATEFCDPCP